MSRESMGQILCMLWLYGVPMAFLVGFGSEQAFAFFLVWIMGNGCVNALLGDD